MDYKKKTRNYKKEEKNLKCMRVVRVYVYKYAFIIYNYYCIIIVSNQMYICAP